MIITPVCGHLCEGLERFLSAGGGCHPTIWEDGQVIGCDDSNPIYITHCPFCGERLIREDAPAK